MDTTEREITKEEAREEEEALFARWEEDEAKKLAKWERNKTNWTLENEKRRRAIWRLAGQLETIDQVGCIPQLEDMLEVQAGIEALVWMVGEWQAGRRSREVRRMLETLAELED